LVPHHFNVVAYFLLHIDCGQPLLRATIARPSALRRPKQDKTPTPPSHRLVAAHYCSTQKSGAPSHAEKDKAPIRG
jgi:hypothetical protein